MEAVESLTKIRELQAEKSVLEWVLGEEQHFDDVAWLLSEMPTLVGGKTACVNVRRMVNKEFEKLPEIKKRLISVKFNEALNRYESKNPVLIECLEVALFLNGAWYAYQEQQKKIDKAIEESSAWHALTRNALGLKIKELLK